jgi:hypothetical protein
MNGWCNIDCSCCISARGAVAGIEGLVTYEEIDTSDRAKMLSLWIDNAVFPDDTTSTLNENSRLGELPVVWEVFLDDAPFKPYGTPWTREDLRAEILRLSKEPAVIWETTPRQSVRCPAHLTNKSARSTDLHTGTG